LGEFVPKEKPEKVISVVLGSISVYSNHLEVSQGIMTSRKVKSVPYSSIAYIETWNSLLLAPLLRIGLVGGAGDLVLKFGGLNGKAKARDAKQFLEEWLVRSRT
jgi:hypothetical protein